MIPQLIPVLAGGAFSLDAWLAANNGARWDFRRLDNCFQEDVGPTPADETDELIGLALSQALWNGRTRAEYLAGQPELVTNGGFDSAASWSVSGSSTIGSGLARVRSIDGSYADVSQLFATVSGRRYAITFDLVSLASGQPAVDFSTNNSNTVVAAVGAKALYLDSRSSVTSGLAVKRLSGATDFEIDNVSVREVSRYAATQATTSRKLKKKPTGASLDGLDDEMLTSYVPGAAANLLMARVKVPTSLSGTQAVLGARTTPDTRSVLYISDQGVVGGGVGAQFNSVIRATSDRRGQAVTFALAYDATTVRLFENDALAYEGARSGMPTTTSPFRIGALNDNGTPLAHFGGNGGEIEQVIAAQPSSLTDLETYRRLAAGL